MYATLRTQRTFPVYPPTGVADKGGGFHKIVLKGSKDDLAVAAWEGEPSVPRNGAGTEQARS
jgi:hypothetical protein